MPIINPRPSKSKQKARRKSKSHVMNDAYPVISTRSRASFTPVVSLNASCQNAYIPEEKDPDAPSDEEENHHDVELQRKLEEPHMRYQRHTWIHAAKSGVSPISIDLPSLPSIPPENKAVHPHALSHFQKLKIAAEVATEKMKRQQRINAEEERIQDIYDQRQRWTEYEAIQSRGGEEGPDLNSLKSDDAVRKMRRQKKDHSFDLSDTGSWYFDFQAHDFDTDARRVEVDPYCDDDSTSQASLSLLSQASMEAQRRLFAAKAKARRKGGSRTSNVGNKSINGKSLRSTNSVPRNDYGPQRAVNQDISSIDTIEGLELEFTSQIGTRNDEERSCVSDIADGYSLSNSTIFTVGSNNDYRVARRRRRHIAVQPDDSDSRNSVDPRFEETLRAVKAGELEPDERIILSGSSLSARLDVIEKQLAAVEQKYPEVSSPVVSDHRRAVMDRSGSNEGIISSLVSSVETPLVSNIKTSTVSHIGYVDDILSISIAKSGGDSSPLSARSQAGLDTLSKQLPRTGSTMEDTSNFREQRNDSSEVKQITEDANAQITLPAHSRVNFSNNHRLDDMSSLGNDEVALDAQSRALRNCMPIVHPKIKAKNTAQRVRCLSHLVHNGKNSLESTSFADPYNSFKPGCIRPKPSNNDDLGRTGDIPLRESRVPLVLGPSTEEFLQFSESYRGALLKIHTDTLHSPNDSPSLSGGVSLCSDASSTSDFGDIMRMEPKFYKDKKKPNPESHDFAESSLLRAEKVEAQVNDVLTKYRESSS